MSKMDQFNFNHATGIGSKMPTTSAFEGSRTSNDVLEDILRESQENNTLLKTIIGILEKLTQDSNKE